MCTWLLSSFFVNAENCSIHEERELDLYCMTCEEVVSCFKCALEMHKGHMLDLLSAAHTLYASEDSSPVKLALEKVNKTLAQLDGRRAQLLNQQAAIEAKINMTIQELHDALDVRKKELIGRLHQVTVEKLGKVTAQVHQNTEIHDELSKQDRDLVVILCNECPKQSMMMGQKVLKKMKETLKEFNPGEIEPADMKFSISPTVKERCHKLGKIFLQEVSPEKCFATGQGLKVAVPELTATATLHSVNEQGEECRHPLSDNRIECVLASDGGQTHVDCAIKMVQPDKYEVSYTPTTRGRHHLHIKVEGEHIKGSPFPVIVIRNSDTPTQTIDNVKTPWGIALGQSEEKITVTENKENTVSIFSHQNGEFAKVNTFGTKGSLPSEFDYIHGVAVDENGHILVVDNSNHRIQKFTADGKFIMAVGKLGSSVQCLEFHYPHGIGIHPHTKMIYVVDTDNHRIQILHPSLTAYSMFGRRGNKEGEFEFPYDVAFDTNGNVYVTDSDNNRIQVFTAEGRYLGQFGEKNEAMKLSTPHGIAIGADNIVYVTENKSNCVSIFTTEGQFLKSFETNSRSNTSETNGFQGVAVDKKGVVYVCNERNSCIHLY